GGNGMRHRRHPQQGNPVAHRVRGRIRRIRPVLEDRMTQARNNSGAAGAARGGKREIGPCERAALTARFVGVAGLAFGGVLVSAARGAPPDHRPGGLTIQEVIGSGFLVPGLSYLMLAALVARRGRWAVSLSSGVA